LPTLQLRDDDREIREIDIDTTSKSLRIPSRWAAHLLALYKWRDVALYVVDSFFFFLFHNRCIDVFLLQNCCVFADLADFIIFF
jgi:hypothetical protein